MAKHIRKHGQKPKLLRRRRSEYKACCAQCRHVSTIPRIVEALKEPGYTIPLPSPFDPRWRVVEPRRINIP